MAITKTTMGIVLFLHVMGVFLWGILAIAAYKILSRRIELLTAFLMCTFFFSVRPKGIVFPEFSNMQIGFSVLLFLFLLLFFENQQKKRDLLAASLCLCLQILSYPSCLIVYFIVILLLLIYSREKKKDVLLFSVACFLQGISYVLFFVTRIGFGTFISALEKIVNADSAHGIGVIVEQYRQTYFYFFNKGLIWLTGCFGITMFVWLFFRFVLHRRMGNRTVLFFSAVVALSDAVVLRDRETYSIVYFLIILAGFVGIKYCSDQEKRIYTIGLALSVGGFLATALLTNLGLLSVAAYLILGVMVSFIPIGRWADGHMDGVKWFSKKGILLFFCMMILLRRGFVIKPMNALPYENIFDLRGIIRQGPALGIVSNYMGAYIANCDFDDWGKYVHPQDRLLMVGESSVDVMPYLYQNVTISVHSTICTPAYDEKLAEYWRLNPEKKPNVIAVSCWYGDLHISENHWIFQWMEEAFGEIAYEDGRFWRFYRVMENEK